MSAYQIFTDATADIDKTLMCKLPNIEIIPMNIEIGNQKYIYGPEGNINPKQFYAMQKQKNYASTSQINPMTYIQYFEPYLKAGIDILYLAFSSGMSGTFQSAQVGIKELQELYPERKIIAVDTLGASIGEGLLVLEALRKQAEGYDLEELYSWIMKYKLQVCHWFIVDEFEHLRHGGRVSASVAAAGTALQIKPLLRVNEYGKLVVVGKNRGRRQGMKALVTRITSGHTSDISRSVFIGHGDCIERARQLEEEVRILRPDVEITITDIGPIIGSHTGPGMLALTYWGNNR